MRMTGNDEKGRVTMLEPNRFKGLMILLGGATIISTIAAFSYMGGSDISSETVVVGEAPGGVKPAQILPNPQPSPNSETSGPQLSSGPSTPAPEEDDAPEGEQQGDEVQAGQPQGGDQVAAQNADNGRIQPDEPAEPTLNPRDINGGPENEGEVPDQVFSNGRVRTIRNPS